MPETAVGFVIGLAIGSFLNVVIFRVPSGLSVVSPGSACPTCREPIRPLDNIPVVSWLVLRARCRSCRAPIPVRYPLVELATAVLFASAAGRYHDLVVAAFVAAACAVCVGLAMIDLDTRRVPNVIVLPATAAAAVWTTVEALLRRDAGIALNSLVAGAAGFAIMFVIAVVSGGMGFGDVKLAAFIGLTTGRLGFEAWVLALFLGFVIGGVGAGALLATGRRGRKDAIPFAPALCMGAVIALFAGPGPVRAWLGG